MWVIARAIPRTNETPAAMSAEVISMPPAVESNILLNILLLSYLLIDASYFTKTFWVDVVATHGVNEPEWHGAVYFDFHNGVFLVIEI